MFSDVLLLFTYRHFYIENNRLAKAMRCDRSHAWASETMVKTSGAASRLGAMEEIGKRPLCRPIPVKS
jgi:hypothetical protein